MTTISDTPASTTSPEPINPSLVNTGEQQSLGLILLAAFALATCLMGLAEGPPMGDHECINALQAREAFETGNWLIPLFEGTPWIRKPPMGTWLIALASLIVDPADHHHVSEFAARLPSAVAGFLTVWVMFWLGRMMWGHRVGLITGFLCAGSVGLIFFARNALVDITMTLFICLAFACFWRGAMHEPRSKTFMVLYYVAFSAAWMSKAPLPGALIGLPLAVYWFITLPLLNKAEGTSGFRESFILQWKNLGRLWLIPGIILFLILGCSWWIYAYYTVDTATELWETEFLDRFTGGLRAHSKSALYYLPLILGMCAPYTLSIPEAVGAAFMKRYRAQRPGIAFAFTWAVIGTIIISRSEFRQPHYLIGVLPAYWLLLAPVVDRLFFGPITLSGRTAVLTGYLLVVALLAGVIAGGLYIFQEYPGFIKMYVPVALGTWLLWILACRAFVRMQRTLAFAFLQASVLLIVCFVWPTSALVINANAEANALAEKLKEHGADPADDIIWVDSRPDASIGYYSGLNIRRIMDENEIAQYRENRREIPDELKWEVAERIIKRLEQPEPVYMIIGAKNYDQLRANVKKLPARVLFQLEGFHPNEPDDELIVFTQQSVETRPANDALPTQPSFQPPPVR